MTTAARPTLTPALGGSTLADMRSDGRKGTGSALTETYSSKDQASHKRLKTRHALQLRAKTRQPIREETMQRLNELSKLIQHEELGGPSFLTIEHAVKDDERSIERRTHETLNVKKLDQEAAVLLANKEEEDDDNANGEDEGEAEDLVDEDLVDEDEDDEDDEELLMQELEKIRKERQEAQERQQQTSNPLMTDLYERADLQDANMMMMMGNGSFKVKRRWDDDVVFRYSNHRSTKPQEKVFINDMVRSEFHKKFMKKYIK